MSRYAVVKVLQPQEKEKELSLFPIYFIQIPLAELSVIFNTNSLIKKEFENFFLF